MSTFGSLTNERVLPGLEVRFRDFAGNDRIGLVIDQRFSPWSGAATYYVKSYGRMVEVTDDRMIGVIR
jgi:hypothetical protein